MNKHLDILTQVLEWYWNKDNDNWYWNDLTDDFKNRAIHIFIYKDLT